MKKNKGFTLMELMMVLLVISILAAIFIPRLTRMKHQAHFFSCEMNEKNLATALETYASNDPHREYPASDNLNVLVTDRYVNGMPFCLTNPGVQYGYESAGTVYTITCTGSHESIGIKLTFPKYTNRTGSFLVETQ